MSSRSAFSSVVAARWLLAAAVVLGPAGCRTAAATGSTLVVNAPESDGDADVFVDGNYVGRLGEIGKGDLPPIKLGPGVHRVEVRKSGRFPVQRTIRVGDDAPEQIVLDAELLEDPS